MVFRYLAYLRNFVIFCVKCFEYSRCRSECHKIIQGSLNSDGGLSCSHHLQEKNETNHSSGWVLMHWFQPFPTDFLKVWIKTESTKLNRLQTFCAMEYLTTQTTQGLFHRTAGCSLDR
mmetsp:Transcript_13093/g.26286  ORF Transcript_13093/g.26286 Transcript_13093/m.26286 type:complete len:118 (-) Transcript_13093:685-1038(-)